MIFIDWVIIIGAPYLIYYYGIIWSPFTLLIMGNRQRALLALLHESSHFLLFSNRRLNDIFSQCFLGAPLFKSITKYRKIHNQHHIELGDPEKDSDFMHNLDDIKSGPFQLYCKHFFSKDVYNPINFIKGIKDLPLKDRIYLVLWWGIFITMLTLIFDAHYTFIFLISFVLARVFIFHAIVTFVIISDHAGLFPGSILRFTRNHPLWSPIKWFLHPHWNGMHLTHHLLPNVPCSNLKKAHYILLNWDTYANAEHCSSYFVGKKNVMQSWLKCLE